MGKCTLLMLFTKKCYCNIHSLITQYRNRKEQGMDLSKRPNLFSPSLTGTVGLLSSREEGEKKKVT